MCVYIYNILNIYIHSGVSLCVYLGIYIHIFVYAHMHVCIYIYICTCTYRYVYIYIYLFIYSAYTYSSWSTGGRSRVHLGSFTQDLGKLLLGGKVLLQSAWKTMV